MQSHVRRTV